MAARGSNAKKKDKRRRHAKARKAAAEMQPIATSHRLTEASRQARERSV